MAQFKRMIPGLTCILQAKVNAYRMIERLGRIEAYVSNGGIGSLSKAPRINTPDSDPEGSKRHSRKLHQTTDR